MTTIAYDGKTLAVDRASWKGGYVWNECRKLHLVNVNRWALAELGFPIGEQDRISGELSAFAFAGDASDVPLLLHWLRHGGDATKPKPVLRDQTVSRGMCLIDGFCYSLTGMVTLERHLRAPVADGGGHEVALGAMLAGANAVRAIQLVASRTSWAAAGVNSFKPGNTEIEYHEISQ